MQNLMTSSEIDVTRPVVCDLRCVRSIVILSAGQEIQFARAIKPRFFAMVVFIVRVLPFMSYVPPLAVNSFDGVDQLLSRHRRPVVRRTGLISLDEQPLSWNKRVRYWPIAVRSELLY